MNTTDAIMKGWLGQVVTLWIRHRIIPEVEIQKQLSVVLAMCYQWAMFSSAIGTEAAKGFISEEDVPFYLYASQLPLTLQFAGYLDALLARRCIRNRKAEKLMEQLKWIMSDRSVMLANWGHVIHADMAPKYRSSDVSPFSIALRRINLDELKSESSR